jgi:hypothetical protein
MHSILLFALFRHRDNIGDSAVAESISKIGNRILVSAQGVVCWWPYVRCLVAIRIGALSANSFEETTNCSWCCSVVQAYWTEKELWALSREKEWQEHIDYLCGQNDL